MRSQSTFVESIKGRERSAKRENNPFERKRNFRARSGVDDFRSSTRRRSSLALRFSTHRFCALKSRLGKRDTTS